MALIRCPRCGNSVSSMAQACPHCGQVLANHQHQQPAQQTSSEANYTKPLIAALAVAVVLLLALGFYLVYSSNQRSTPIQSSTTATTPAQPQQPATASHSEPKVIPDGSREYTIESKQYGYAWVRSGTDKHSETNKVKKILTGERFYGKRLDNNPDWMEVYDNDGTMIGYMYYKCARIPKD